MELKSFGLLSLLPVSTNISVMSERPYGKCVFHSHSNFPAESQSGTEVSLSCHTLPTLKTGGQIIHCCWCRPLDLELCFFYVAIGEWSMSPGFIYIYLYLYLYLYLYISHGIRIRSFIKISVTLWGPWALSPKFQDTYLALAHCQPHHHTDTRGHVFLDHAALGNVSFSESWHLNLHLLFLNLYIHL